MRRSRSFVDQRRERIAEMVGSEGRVSVADLAERLEASLPTIRRDLEHLEREGRLARRYGEALMVNPTAEGRAQDEAEAFRERSRDAIARAVAELVGPGETIFVGGSSTALQVVSHITSADVTIITNNTNIIGRPLPPDCTVLFSGGELRTPRGYLCGEIALNSLRLACPTKALLGCSGISLAKGVLCTALQEAPVDSVVIERASETYLLADSAKLLVESGFRYADIDQIDLLVTDARASSDTLSEFLHAGLRDVLQLDPDEGAA